MAFHSQQKKSGVRFSYSEQFQTNTIRTLFQEPDFALTIAAHLPADLFGTKLNRWLVKTILDYADKYSAGISQEALIHQAEIALDEGKFKKAEVDALTAALLNLTKKVSDRSYVKDEVFRFVKHMKLKESVLQAAEFFE